MTSPTSGLVSNEPSEGKSSEMQPTSVESQEQICNGQHEEQPRKSLFPPKPRTFASSHHQTSSLPFPLNLPPSYPVYRASSSPAAPARPQRSPALRQSASIPATPLSTNTSDALEGHARSRNVLSASPCKGKGKGTLDTFMDSRQGTMINEPESSGSESDLPLRKVLPSSDDCPFSDSSALASSSPPSSSPLRTPKESSPFRPVYRYAASPTQQGPSRPTLPYILPPGPYSHEKPSCSLSALIGQALNASNSGSLTLSDVYSYVSTVYPHFDRGEQSWMSSIRHNLSMQDAFERVPDENGSNARSGKSKSKGRGGSWRITPGYEACFLGGKFVRKAGPVFNQSRKRLREDDAAGRGKKSKTESRPRSVTPLASTSTRLQRPSSPTRTVYSGRLSRRSSSPPSLTTSQSTVPSEALPDPTDIPLSSPVPAKPSNDVMTDDSPELPLSLVAARPNNTKGCSKSSSLEPGFELARNRVNQSPLQFLTSKIQGDASKDLFTRIMASTISAHASQPPSDPSCSTGPASTLYAHPLTSSSDPRASTPPPQDSVRATFSPIRTPMSHRGVHMSPSRSLAHYKSSLEPEWRTTAVSYNPGGRHTPPLGHRELGDETSTPKKVIFPPDPPPASPMRTPARSSQRHQRGYDPYDPNAVLADELASIKNAREPQDSPGGFFGKEGRRLLYESPGVPSRSHWRFRDDF